MKMKKKKKKKALHTITHPKEIYQARIVGCCILKKTENELILTWSKMLESKQKTIFLQRPTGSG